MKSAEFLDWLTEHGFGKVMTVFMAVGILAAVVALFIVYIFTRR